MLPSPDDHMDDDNVEEIADFDPLTKTQKSSSSSVLMRRKAIPLSSSTPLLATKSNISTEVTTKAFQVSKEAIRCTSHPDRESRVPTSDTDEDLISDNPTEKSAEKRRFKFSLLSYFSHFFCKKLLAIIHIGHIFRPFCTKIELL